MSALPWIKLASDFPTHPKALHLADALDDPRAWSYPVQLWCWCAHHAADGRLRGSARVVETAAGWRGKRGDLVAALEAAGLLDPVPEADGGGWRVHDWEEHAGAHADRLQRDRDRAATRRAELRAAAELAGRLGPSAGPQGPPAPPERVRGQSSDVGGPSADSPRTAVSFGGRRVP